jgi:putative peptidoglycan lipid II flippase
MKLLEPQDSVADRPIVESIRATTGLLLAAATRIASVTLLVKGAALAKDVAVAWNFGTGDSIDAFVIAAAVASFVSVIIGGSLQTAFMPSYIRIRQHQGPAAAQALLSSMGARSICLLTLVAIFTLAAAPWYLPVLARGFDQAKLRLTFTLLVIMMPAGALTGVGFLWTAVLNASGRFALPALAPLMTPLLTLGMLVVGSSWGVLVLAAAYLVGALLEITLLGALVSGLGIRLALRWQRPGPEVRLVWLQFLPMIGASCLMGGTNLVDQGMAASLGGGSVAALAYGYKVVAALLTLAAGVWTAALPFFSTLVARRDWKALQGILLRSLAFIFAGTIPLAGLLFIGSRLIVQTVFQRGAFSVEDTDIVATVLSFYALQIPAYVGGIVVMRLISAMGRNHLLTWLFGMNLLVDVVLNYLFMHWFGVAGIALSSACVYTVSFLIVFAMAWRLIGLKVKSETPVETCEHREVLLVERGR